MRRLCLALAGALAIAACASGNVATETSSPALPSPSARPSAAPSASPSPPPSPTTAASPSPAPSPLVSNGGNVSVERPLTGARVVTPIAVAGRARVFEAAISWRLVDAAGRELAKDFATASQGAPEFGTYSFPIAFRVSAETGAFVEVFSRSPRDGGVTDLVRVPVTLVP